MANHKSAKKRSKQSIARNLINNQYLTKIRSSITKFRTALKSNKAEDIEKSLSEVNSAMAKATKRGILTKHQLSRKLSSLSNQIKKK